MNFGNLESVQTWSYFYNHITGLPPTVSSTSQGSQTRSTATILARCLGAWTTTTASEWRCPMLCSFLYSPPGRLLWGDLQRSEWDNSRRFQPSSESIPWNGCHLSSFLHQHPETEVRCFSSTNVTLFWYIWQSSEDGITGLGAPSEAFFDFSSVIVSFIHCTYISIDQPTLLLCSAVLLLGSLLLRPLSMDLSPWPVRKSPLE